MANFMPSRPMPRPSLPGQRPMPRPPMAGGSDAPSSSWPGSFIGSGSTPPVPRPGQLNGQEDRDDSLRDDQWAREDTLWARDNPTGPASMQSLIGSGAGGGPDYAREDRLRTEGQAREDSLRMGAQTREDAQLASRNSREDRLRAQEQARRNAIMARITGMMGGQGSSAGQTVLPAAELDTSGKGGPDTVSRLEGPLADKEAAARASAFARAKETAGQNAHASMAALQGVVDESGMMGSSVHAAQAGQIVGQAGGGINNLLSDQAQSEAGQATDTANMEYQGQLQQSQQQAQFQQQQQMQQQQQQQQQQQALLSLLGNLY